MATVTRSRNSEAAIWERVIHPNGELTPQNARAILEIDFTDEDRERMHELAIKNQRGKLSPEEEADIDNFCRVGNLLSILHSKARRVLKQRRR